MAARQYYDASSSARTTTTSDIDQIKVTLTFTPDANSTYYIIGFAIYDGVGSTTDGVGCKLYHGSTMVVDTWQAILATSDRMPFVGIMRYQAGASPTAQSFSIRWSSWAGGAAGCSDAFVVAIKGDPADQYAESATLSTTTSTSPQTKTSITFTPATAGEYVILTTASVASANTRSDTIDLYDGATSYSRIVAPSSRWPDDSVPYFGMVKTGSLSGAQTFSLRHYTSNAANLSGAQNAAILALRASGFEKVIGARNATAGTVSSTTPTDHSTVSDTMAAVAHLVLGCSQIGASTTGAGRMLAGGTATTANELKDNAGASSRSWHFNFMSLDTPASAGSRSYAIQHWRTGASGSQTMDESSIAVLQLAAAQSGTTTSRLAPDAILASTNLA